MSVSRQDAGSIALRIALAHADFSLDVDTEVPMRGITGVFGPSGAGKTSLLRCIAGLDRPDTGRIVVAGETWDDDAATTHVPPHRRGVGYVFQEPRLFPHLDVQGNLGYGARRGAARGAYRDDVVALLGIDHLLERRVDALSGGEAQRVAIARALLRSPELLLMDEPLASLDEARRQEILPYLDRLHAELSVPVLYVSHDVDEVVRLCDRLLVMRAGRIVAEGPLDVVLESIDPPPLGDGISVLGARVTGYDADFDLTEVMTGAGVMHVAGRHPAGAGVRIIVRASDVSLCRERPLGTSILNVLPTVIEAISGSGGTSATARVRLRAGQDSLVATVTRRSISDLGLEPGQTVFAQVKTAAVRGSSLRHEQAGGGDGHALRDAGAVDR